MAATIIPTSQDIYLEVDGRKVAVVQSLHRPDQPRPAPRWRPLAKVSRWPPFRGSSSMCWNSPESTPPTRPWPTGSTFTPGGF